MYFNLQMSALICVSGSVGGVIATVIIGMFIETFPQLLVHLVTGCTLVYATAFATTVCFGKRGSTKKQQDM